MPADTRPPAGFCPNCHYAMDPGRCPECGSDVPEHRLVRDTPQTRRRRRIRRVLLLLTMAAILGGGTYAYFKVKWIRHAPASWLLAFQGDETSRATCELVRRFE